MGGGRTHGKSKGKGRAGEGRPGKGKGKSMGGNRDLYRMAFEEGLRKGKGNSRGGSAGVMSKFGKRDGDRKGGKRGGKGGKNRKEEEPTAADLDGALEDYFGDGTKKAKTAAAKGGANEKALDAALNTYMGGAPAAAETSAPASKGKSEGILKEDKIEEEKTDA